MRKMIWVKSVHSESWACSECAWAFNPSGPPRGTSLDEMKQNFECQRDEEFASHVCAAHPRAKGPRAMSAKDEPRFPRRSDDRT
jgi:rubredoxin